MHLLSDLMETKLHRSQSRGSGQSRQESWSVIDLLVTAED